MKIYHKQIGFPKTLVIPEATLQLSYTKHALERQEKDYKLLVTPAMIILKPSNVFEVYTEDDLSIKKALVRISYNKTQDMILVIQPTFEKKQS